MTEHRDFDGILLVGVFFLPAAVSLFFAWSVWIANKRPAIATWRLATFKWGLISAPVTMAVFIPSCLHMIRTMEPARGVWLMANRLGIILWLAGFAAALTGRGWGRITLVLSGIFIFLGVFGIDLGMIP
jgi:hypothetical protein